MNLDRTLIITGGAALSEAMWCAWLDNVTSGGCQKYYENMYNA